MFGKSYQSITINQDKSTFLNMGGWWNYWMYGVYLSVYVLIQFHK